MRLNRFLVQLVLCMLSLAICTATLATDVDQQQEGSIIENPFLAQSPTVSDRPNKSEMELHAIAAENVEDDMAMAMSPNAFTDDPRMMHMHPHQVQNMQTQNVTPMIRVPRNSYQPNYTHKILNDYAEQMAMDLMARAKNLDTQSKIGIASFVDLTRNLQTTTVLGNQLSESFMNEIQAYGLSVVDYKALDEIFVGQEGDLIFDRSGPRGNMQYVLSGTMQRNGRGVQVNARIIQLKDNVVVASTKGFIPHFIVSSLTPDYLLLQ